jgi:hypothetical protein
MKLKEAIRRIAESADIVGHAPMRVTGTIDHRQAQGGDRNGRAVSVSLFHQDLVVNVEEVVGRRCLAAIGVTTSSQHPIFCRGFRAGGRWFQAKKGAIRLVNVATTDQGHPAERLRQRGEHHIDIRRRVGDHVDERLRVEYGKCCGQAACVSACDKERNGARRYELMPAVDDPDLMPRGEKLLRDPGANEAGTAEQ